MRMHHPPHPGSLLREDVFPSLEVSVTEAARQLRVSRTMLSRILNEHAGISADMALRLERWLEGPDAGTWLRMQAEHDLWIASRHPPRGVTRHAA